jgi:hypothetical protein
MNQSNKMSNAEKIRSYIDKHPNATAKKISATLSVPPTSVYAVKHKAKAKADAVYRAKAEAAANVPEVADTGKPITPAPDMVNHPPHYKMGGIETIDFIEAKALGFHLGNVVKYVTRADHKGNKVEDLQKAQFYLRRAIEIART